MPEADHSRSPGRPAGREWLIDATGCCPRRLADLALLQRLFAALVAELGLTPLGPGVWYQFPPPGGVTGMTLLSESHLTCHTWPELGTAAFNLFCCRPRPDWPWAERLRDCLEAQGVTVRVVERQR